MEDQVLKAADVVKLKSGGPAMTVIEAGKKTADCIWFDTQNRLQQGSFEQAVLVRID